MVCHIIHSFASDPFLPLCLSCSSDKTLVLTPAKPLLLCTCTHSRDHGLQRVTQLGWLFSLYIYDCLLQTEWYLSIILFFPGPLIFYFIPFSLSSNLLSLAAPSLPDDDLLHWENRSKHKRTAVGSRFCTDLPALICAHCTIYCYVTNYPKS